MNFDKEWEFIIFETHRKKSIITNFVKREVLFAMQVLLSKSEIKNYFGLKKIYLKYK